MKQYNSNAAMILHFLKGSKRYFAAGILLASGSSLLELLRPRIVQYTLDAILGGDSSEVPSFVRNILNSAGTDALLSRLWIPALAVVICTLAAQLFGYGYFMNTAIGSENFVKTMRDSLFEHIQHLPVSWHAQHKTGDIIQRCTSDVEEVKSFLGDQLVNLCNVIINVLLAIVFMFRTDVPLALTMAACVPLIVASSVWFHQKIAVSFLKCDQCEGVLSTIAQENFTGVRVVRAFGREAEERKRFLDQSNITTDAWVRLSKYFSVYFVIMDFLTGAVLVAIVVWGSIRAVKGLLTVGGLVAMISYYAMLMHPVRTMGQLISEMSKTGVSITRLREVMSAETEQDRPNAVTPSMTGDIVFHHVSFGYPGQPELLHDISFRIPAGATVGILGGTGSGKSTIAALLCRLYPLQEGCGSITIGGVDIADIKADWLRKNVGYVMQESFLFSRSLGDNIAITCENKDLKEIRRVTGIACLKHAIESFPKGLDTIVGERGVTLSGGQKQRTAIARTLMQKCPVLIFDDSLSALDAETDAEIRHNLKKSADGASFLLISHRIQSLREADHILVLENGRITDEGTHEELFSRPGLYRTVCSIQSGSDIPEEGGEVHD